MHRRFATRSPAVSSPLPVRVIAYVDRVECASALSQIQTSTIALEHTLLNITESCRDTPPATVGGSLADPSRPQERLHERP
jgi:hypothetical protein